MSVYLLYLGQRKVFSDISFPLQLNPLHKVLLILFKVNLTGKAQLS